MNPLLNIAIYQLIWFIAVLGGERLVWLGLLLLAVHFLLTPRPQSDLLLALVPLLLYLGGRIAVATDQPLLTRFGR